MLGVCSLVFVSELIVFFHDSELCFAEQSLVLSFVMKHCFIIGFFTKKNNPLYAVIMNCIMHVVNCIGAKCCFCMKCVLNNEQISSHVVFQQADMKSLS